MESSNREKIEDMIFNEDLSNENFHNKLFVRVGAKSKNFKKIDFSHTYFEHCYFRDIVFDSCNFNGCKFNNCNFIGSSFPGSKFEYASFEKTILDGDILDSNCPSHDNLILKFARSLRLNYQSIGDAELVNKAIKIELAATKRHLYDSWNSNKGYYRNKYKGFKQIEMFFKWLNFKVQEFIWGNGESILKLLRTGIIIWILMSLNDTIILKNPLLINSYEKSFTEVPSLFFGITKPNGYSDNYITLITILRLVGFALFTSLIIKRFNRR